MTQLEAGPSRGSLAYYGDLFANLPRVVRHTGELTRFVAFQRQADEAHTTHFLGVEVERLDDLPDGLEGWALGETDRTVRSAGGDSVEPLSWLWHSTAGTGRRVGEFRLGEGGPFHLTANAYFRPDGAGAESDDIHLVEPDPTWPQRYADFATWLAEALGPDLALRIEHYGSTAIPGIPAKPVIDILVEVPSFEVARSHTLPLFNDLQWDYWWHGGHMLFVRRTRLMGARTHHVHLAPRGHKLWEGLIFRDHLRTHPDDARAYADLKRRLVEAHAQERERYTNAKTEFVARILAQAG